MIDQSAAHRLTPDTQATVLLCGRFGRALPHARPLTAGEYDGLALWLLARKLRPADLLAAAGLQRWLDERDDAQIAPDRLAALLDRRVALALAVEGWTNAGLWVIGRGDPIYPARLRGKGAPPLLYGTGNLALLALGGLAIVGSREADSAALEYTARLAKSCAAQKIQVISGAARGVDNAAITAATEWGGTAVGVLADSLGKAATSGKYLLPLLEGSLCLITPYDPDAGFSIGGAMGRNKYIYALADHAAVISSGQGSGGTWAGAIEALKAAKTPTYVRIAPEAPAGNARLLDHGAHPMPPEPWPDLRQQFGVY